MDWTCDVEVEDEEFWNIGMMEYWDDGILEY
jgi:hypothetical protein